MFNIVLIEPEIPPNTGNIIRLCANTGVRLHLVEPLGFPLDDAKMRRAGLDYREYMQMRVHPNWQALLDSEKPELDRLFTLTTRGTHYFHQPTFKAGDWFVFGSETRGLSTEMLAQFAPDQRLRLPMQAGSRSLNLSNAAAIVVYEAWRQQGFPGGI